MRQKNMLNNTLCNLYSSHLSSIIQSGIRRKRVNGDWCGKAPRGYRNIHDNYDHFKPRIVKDPEYFDRIKKAFKLLLTERYSIADVSKIVKMEPSFLRRVFRNPFYAGLNKDIDFPEFVYEGNWEPMITREEFCKVQKILEKYKKKPNAKTA